MKDSLARVRQIVWMAICLLAVVVFVKGMAVWFPALQQVCTSTALECQQRSQLTPAEAESLQAFGYSLSTYAWYNLLTRLLQKILGVGIGLLLFWRKPSDVTAWVASLFLIVGIETSVGTILALSQPVWLMATRVLGYVGALTFFLFFYIFPTGEFAPRWTRWAMTIAALVFFFLGFFPDSPLSINRSSVTAALFGIPLFVSVGAAQILRYRNLSDATARTQTKWIVAAAGAGVAAFLASLAVVLSNAGKPQVFNSYWILVDLGFSLITYLLPIAIAIAILRYHLWDIDVIIRRTLVYTAVTALLALVFFGSIILLQRLFTGLTGQESPVAVVASTLVIAALFSPLRRRVQDFVDRRFYRRKYDAQRVLSDFAAAARNETDVDRLAGRLGFTVESALNPASVAVWMPGEDRQ